MSTTDAEGMAFSTDCASAIGTDADSIRDELIGKPFSYFRGG
jgi:hypothetical protein